MDGVVERCRLRSAVFQIKSFKFSQALRVKTQVSGLKLWKLGSRVRDGWCVRLYGSPEVWRVKIRSRSLEVKGQDVEGGNRITALRGVRVRPEGRGQRLEVELGVLLSDGGLAGYCLVEASSPQP